MWPEFFITYVAGPVAALLPQRWRKALPALRDIPWARAAAVSGTLELAAGLVGLCYWYMDVMTPLIRGGTEGALMGKFTGTGITEHQIAGAALIVFATHPVTWLLAYLFFEGAVRLFAAVIAEDARGILPLYLVDRAIFIIANRRELRMGEELRRHASATADHMRVEALVARTKEVPDEMCPSKAGNDEFLEIRACRKKEDWVPPRTVRVDDAYYRLEANSMDKSERPFRYRLRRLEAGVPGRTVLLYNTKDAVAKPSAGQ